MSTLQELKAYTLPKLYAGKQEWFIYFSAFDPVSGKLKRKKIKLNSITNVTERRKYARGMIVRISEKLACGWNPWIEAETNSAYVLFNDVLDHYRKYCDKMLREDLYREDTHKRYISYIKNLDEYNKSKKVPITYIYQMNRDFITQFLDEIYIGRDNTVYTRDNYLSWLRTFSTYCLNQNFLTTNPTDGIKVIGKCGRKKKREVISMNDLEQLHTYLEQKNKHYLLACYILYYCFIRPKEMSHLQLSHFSIKRQTVFVPDTVSKNRKDGTITLPAKVIHLMIELGTFNHPNDYYLFSDGFMPGSERRTEKQFRDFWTHHVRKDLKFPEKYKFYSLKDTGITNMLRHYDTLSVRDQARHSSILMTDIYTPHDIQTANELIKNYNGEF